MGNKKMLKRKYDRTRDDALHNEKQKLTNIEDIANDDVTRDLDQNVDDMNVQNQTQEELNQVCTHIVNLFKMQ